MSAKFDKRRALRLVRGAMEHLASEHPTILENTRKVSRETLVKMKTRTFLRHYCWVVYASGFRYKTIKTKFPEIKAAFHGFDPEKLRRMRSVTGVLRVFNNEKKATGFLQGSKAILNEGFPQFKKRLLDGDPGILTELPGIGPITKNHLAKNIGQVDVAKDDIWLERIAEMVNATSVAQLTQYLSQEIGESQHTIDLALWKFAEDGHLEWKAQSRDCK